MSEFYDGIGWSSSLYSSRYPLRFDSYSCCSFGCVYCNAMFRRATGSGRENYLKKQVRFVDVERVKRLWENPAGTPYENFIRSRKCIQVGTLSDPFDGFERVHGKTLELLRFWKEKRQPILFSTKSAWWVHDERYAELFRDEPLWKLRVSFSTFDNELSQSIEPHTPIPSERMQALKVAGSWNLGNLTLRVRPAILGVFDRGLESSLKEAAGYSVNSVSTLAMVISMQNDVFRMSILALMKSLGKDIIRDYAGRYTDERQELPDFTKSLMYRKIQKVAQECGMEFSTSDPCFQKEIYKQKRPEISNDSHLHLGSWKDALGTAAARGEVKFSDILPEMEATFGTCKADVFATNTKWGRAKYSGLTMCEYMRLIWNDVTHPWSPCSRFPGVLSASGRRDEKGDVVYFYKKGFER